LTAKNYINCIALSTSKYTMNSFDIIKIGDPILKKKCEEINDDNMEQMTWYLKEMLAFVKWKGSGAVWLALPQIGEPYRWFVINAKNRNVLETEIFINPILVNKSPASYFMDEECLSEPGVLVKMKRSLSVTVEYTNWNWTRTKKSFYWFPARVIQHELDHLNGVLLTDYIS